MIENKEFRLCAENLILKKNKNKYFFYKKIKINLKPILYRTDYVHLLNDREFFSFYNNFKNYPYIFSSKKNFEYAKILIKNQKHLKLNYWKNLFFCEIKNYEFVYNFYYLLKNLFNFQKNKNHNKQRHFFFYIRNSKHFFYMQPLLKKINIKCIFIVPSANLQKRLKLTAENSIYLESIKFSKSSFKYNSCANISFYVKSFFEIIKKNNPLFILFVEGDDPLSEILSQVAKGFKIKSISFQWGAFPFKKPKLSFRSMSCNYFISWGNYFTKQLQAYNKKVKFLNFGHFNFENLTMKKKNKVIFFLQPPCLTFGKELF